MFFIDFFLEQKVNNDNIKFTLNLEKSPNHNDRDLSIDFANVSSLTDPSLMNFTRFNNECKFVV